MGQKIKKKRNKGGMGTNLGFNQANFSKKGKKSIRFFFFTYNANRHIQPSSYKQTIVMLGRLKIKNTQLSYNSASTTKMQPDVASRVGITSQ